MKSSLLLAAILAACSASAQSWLFQSQLSGQLVEPPNDSLASGLGSFMLTLTPFGRVPDADAPDLFSYSVSYSGLASQISSAHIHTLSGDVLVTLSGAINSTSGMLSGSVWVPADVSSALRSETYVDIHTSGLPGGEIQGQLEFTGMLAPVGPGVPEVDSALLVGGLLGAGALALRLRKTTPGTT